MLAAMKRILAGAVIAAAAVVLGAIAEPAAALSNLAGTSLRPPGMCWHGPIAGAHENFGYWGDCKKRPENESANGARAQASQRDRLNAQRR